MKSLITFLVTFLFMLLCTLCMQQHALLPVSAITSLTRLQAGGVQGLVNGDLTQATFQSPRGLAWLDKARTKLLLGDYFCIRQFNTITGITSTFAGLCGTFGKVDISNGNNFNAVRMSYPYDITVYQPYDLNNPSQPVVIFFNDYHYSPDNNIRRLIYINNEIDGPGSYNSKSISVYNFIPNMDNMYLHGMTHDPINQRVYVISRYSDATYGWIWAIIKVTDLLSSTPVLTRIMYIVQADPVDGGQGTATAGYSVDIAVDLNEAKLTSQPTLYISDEINGGKIRTLKNYDSGSPILSTLPLHSGVLARIWGLEYISLSSTEGFLYACQDSQLSSIDLTTIPGKIIATPVAGLYPHMADQDGSPATTGRLNRPMHSASDYNGNVYVIDSLSFNIRRISGLPALPNQDGSVSGDPQFAGFQGQQYQVHGIPDAYFNLISTPSTLVNSKFIYIASGSCYYNDTECWTHPGTYVSEMGITIVDPHQHNTPRHSNDDDHYHADVSKPLRIKVIAGSHDNGLRVWLDDVEIFASNGEGSQRRTIYHLPHQGRVTFLKPSIISIRTHDFDLVMTNSDHFINTAFQLMDRHILRAGAKIASAEQANQVYPNIPIHGLVGQTWKNVQYKDKSKPYEGIIDDYVVNDLFDSDFAYNNFR